jgi:hypothetical protein
VGQSRQLEMLAGVFSRGLARLGRSFVSHCDAAPNAEETPSLIEQADAAIENEKAKIRTPMQFENLKNTLSQGSVHPYDGFRVIVQKQVNLNSVVSHL